MRRLLPLALLLLALPLLGGCNLVLLAPSGDIAMQQRNLLIASTALMMIIIVPVMALTVYFAWRYRAANREAEAEYDPEWSHSLPLEVVIWTAPLLIIIALGAMTWLSTHLLDPFRPLDRIDAQTRIPEGTRPLEVQVVALDWKWLFLYPEQGIAVVNELAAPVDRPISFKLTSSTVMNSFYIPALAGQIYAMAGMETQLHAVINKPGSFKGFSANYSGAGFSQMHFNFHGLDRDGFEAWVAKAKGGQRLDRAAFAELEKPSEAVPVRYFGSVEGGLYQAILNLCAAEGRMCMHEMMMIDAKGGAGLDSHANRDRLRYDRVRDEAGHGAPTVPASGQPARSDAPPTGTNDQDSGRGGPAPPQVQDR
ncbi:ubiquinol oxidase subunit II [Enterovirga rhinocerotis]|uniref:ubiquinol oxidase subunit II n=1 Tax=Enterovirga rhinocerotis TaxID=1339210 RepID=UPI001414E367|nr:ubiquinol oxidase subunit II [Enterovirga rhinocerotis]